MNTFTAAVDIAALEYFFTTTAPTLARPTAWYVALFSDAGTTEFTTTDFASYARKSVTFTLTGQVLANAAAVTWTVDAGATPPAVLSIGIYDALTAGNLLALASVPSVTAAAGEAITYVAGALTLTQN